MTGVPNPDGDARTCQMVKRMHTAAQQECEFWAAAYTPHNKCKPMNGTFKEPSRFVLLTGPAELRHSTWCLLHVPPHIQACRTIRAARCPDGHTSTNATTLYGRYVGAAAQRTAISTARRPDRLGQAQDSASWKCYDQSKVQLRHLNQIVSDDGSGVCRFGFY